MPERDLLLKIRINTILPSTDLLLESLDLESLLKLSLPPFKVIESLLPLILKNLEDLESPLD